MRKKAFITGISGQDGSYLAELLLEKNYDVYGIIRNHSVTESQTKRINHLINQINLDTGDITDSNIIHKLIKNIQPDEIYNLAAHSQVHTSFQLPQYTNNVNVIGTINMLEACREYVPYCKFYQAGSSEIFGHNVDDDGMQRETTAMSPVSPYGCSKLFGHHICKIYRSAYKMFVSNGINFNHTSARSSSCYIIPKLIRGAKNIAEGKQVKLELGNMQAARDFGHAKDHVEAMHLMLNHREPDDFVIASGTARKIEDMCEFIFKQLNLDYKNYVVETQKYIRPEEIQQIKGGDASKAKKLLGWKPKYTFESIIMEMLN